MTIYCKYHKKQRCDCNTDYFIKWRSTNEIYAYCNHANEMKREVKRLNKLAGFKLFCTEVRVK